MTAEQRWILDLTEILTIRIECRRCGVALSIKPIDWRDAPIACPSCATLWDRPHVPDLPPSPLQLFGLGLRQLLQQQREATKSGGELPYRVRVETPDPTMAKYGIGSE